MKYMTPAVTAMEISGSRIPMAPYCTNQVVMEVPVAKPGPK